MLLNCPLPIATTDRVLLGHGSGGKLSAELMRDIFLPALSNPILARLDDQAQLEIGGLRLAFTTDSFVVKPLFFPGGDIGSLAVHGTINDLATAGARPLYLSAAYVIEEGFPLSDLRRIADSMGRAAQQAGVSIVTGDTKVVERGAADGLFLNTTGIGLIPANVTISAAAARPGDVILLSGSLGNHGIAIMAAREGLQFDTILTSDSAALHTLVEAMLAAAPAIRCLRDPTRGGLSSTLNEIAAQSATGMRILETEIPIRAEVQGACEMLGLDPLYVANEGKLVAIVAPEDADAVLAAMRAHPLGRSAVRIGAVTQENPGRVVLQTAYGTSRIVDMLAGDQLPRIC
ncbi:MAG TPA: hydrogenase expression/formation protein HypE [Paludibaculum sp.]|jgi:hydrogenase expression/formation protein HypE